MHNVSPTYETIRLLKRDGPVWRYRDLTALARDLIAGGFYTLGGVYGLNAGLVERFTTWRDPDTGRCHANGDFVVERHDGTRLSREVIAQACIAYRMATRRKTRAGGRGWYKRPRRHKLVTKADRRQAIHAVLDLREFDEAWTRIVEPKCRIDDPYEARPRRKPQRSWKSHRGSQYL